MISILSIRATKKIGDATKKGACESSKEQIPIIVMTLGMYLRKKRLTQQQFADMLGVAQSLVSDWTLGKRVPRPAMMSKIASVTNGRVKPQDFYVLEDAA